MQLLYHHDVYMPKGYELPIFEGRLRYGPHARNAAATDRYGVIELPTWFSAAGSQLIEVEYDEELQLVIKQVWRQPLDDTRDIVLVMGRGGFVKTVWANLRTDVHRSLKKSRYVRR